MAPTSSPDIQNQRCHHPAQTRDVPPVRNALDTFITVAESGVTRWRNSLEGCSFQCHLASLHNFRASASTSYRFCNSAREGSFGEIPAAGRAIGGREENAGPRHLHRNGSQPLQPVRSQHCGEVPWQKRPADDAARGGQGTACISCSDYMFRSCC